MLGDQRTGAFDPHVSPPWLHPWFYTSCILYLLRHIKVLTLQRITRARCLAYQQTVLFLRDLWPASFFIMREKRGRSAFDEWGAVFETDECNTLHLKACHLLSKAKQLSIKRVAQFKSLPFWKGERWLHDRQKQGLAEAYYLCWHKEERHNLFLCERQFRCHSNWYPFLSFIWQPEWAGLPPVSYFQRYFYAVIVDPWTLSKVNVKRQTWV